MPRYIPGWQSRETRTTWEGEVTCGGGVAEARNRLTAPQHHVNKTKAPTKQRDYATLALLTVFDDFLFSQIGLYERSDSAGRCKDGNGSLC